MIPFMVRCDEWLITVFCILCYFTLCTPWIKTVATVALATSPVDTAYDAIKCILESRSISTHRSEINRTLRRNVTYLIFMDIYAFLYMRYLYTIATYSYNHVRLQYSPLGQQYQHQEVLWDPAAQTVLVHPKINKWFSFKKTKNYRNLFFVNRRDMKLRKAKDIYIYIFPFVPESQLREIRSVLAVLELLHPPTGSKEETMTRCE